MASRKHSRGNSVVFFIGFLVVIITAMIAASVLLLPLVFAALTLISLPIYLYRAQKHGYTISDFWLNDEAKIEFRQLGRKVLGAKREIHEAKEAGLQNDVRITQQGRFDRRSRLGAELQKRVSESEAELDRFESDFTFLRTYPYREWLRLRRVYVRLWMFLFGTVAWILSAAVTTQIVFKDVRAGIKEIVAFPARVLNEYTGYFDHSFEAGIAKHAFEWTVYGVSAAVSVLVILILWPILRATYKRMREEPPYVSLSNVDDF